MVNQRQKRRKRGALPKTVRSRKASPKKARPEALKGPERSGSALSVLMSEENFRQRVIRRVARKLV